MLLIKNHINMSTHKLFWLSFFSGGIFLIYYLAKYQDYFNNFFKKEVISDTCLYFAIIFLGANFYAHMQNNGVKSSVNIGFFIFSILLLVMSYRLAKEFEKYSNKKLNPIMIFFFHIFYLNYFINNSENFKPLK